MKTVGILGGFGPETTAEFYISIVNKNRELGRNNHPRIIIHNSPVQFKLEEDAVKRARSIDKFLPLLLEGVKTLQDEVDFIVLPCNTLHVFIEDIRRESKVPVLSIIEEVVTEVKRRKLKKVGLLATLKTFKEKLFETKLEQNGIQLIKPTLEEQRKISGIINLILKGVKSNDLKIRLLKIIDNLRDKGAKGVILGCTDLQLVLKQEDSPIHLIDTMDVLASSTTRIIAPIKKVG